MPELPEVETVKSDLENRLVNKVIHSTLIRCGSLRFPVPTELPDLINKKKVLSVTRRAKYILVHFKHGIMGIHLGMSGTVRADKKNAEPRKHDHIDWNLSNSVLRYNDPRRFGMVFWHYGDGTPIQLKNTGIEPLSTQFNSNYLAKLCKDRKVPIKTLLMDGSKVAGIGNIYASEILFNAKVSPFRLTNTITKSEARLINTNIKSVLRRAIAKGGSTLRDHRHGEDKIGYFQLEHNVYGKHDTPCPRCKTLIERKVLCQRSTFHCPECQT